MAFAKSAEPKTVKNMAEEDRLWRMYMESEENTNKSWDAKWRWVLDEYKNLHEQLDEVSKASAFLKEVNKVEKEEDKRSIRKIPESTNHEYGWLAAKPEFRLDSLGPDLTPASPLPDKFKLIY